MRTLRGMTRRNISQGDVLFEEGCVRAAGNHSDFPSTGVEHFVAIPGDAAIAHFQSNQSAGKSRRFLLFNCRAPDKVAFIELAIAIQPGLENGDRLRYFVPVERHLRSNRRVLRAPKPHGRMPNSLPAASNSSHTASLVFA